MKNIILSAALLLTAVAAQAQTKTTTTTTTTTTTSAPAALPLGIQAVGWDDYLKHVTARIGLSQNNAVDVGLGLNINTATDETEFLLGGFYLLKLQDWGMIDNYLTVGASAVLADEVSITAFGGLQPEITLLDRVIVSFRFGIQMPLTPDFALQTTGSPVSVVEGFNFKVIW